jgi:nucleotidyltransferase/DNA polymerase involved in DNA repair
VGELAAVPRERLTQRFGEKTGAWLAAVAVGRDDEPVQQRALPKSVGCGKNFGDHRDGGGKYFTAARLRSFAQARRAAPRRVSAACRARAAPAPRPATTTPMTDVRPPRDLGRWRAGCTSSRPRLQSGSRPT